jgi:metal-responsive CopG/Arc/MetJ family transcriptional regulator
MDFKNREERNNWREKRLNELLGYLATRYEHNQRSLTDFTVKIKDVKYLLENFIDVLEDSNIYTSVDT